MSVLDKILPAESTFQATDSGTTKNIAEILLEKGGNLKAASKASNTLSITLGDNTVLAYTPDLGQIDIINNFVSTATNKVASANTVKVLNDRIDDLSTIGRFLSNFDASSGLPATMPSTLPYTFKGGDYFIVSTSGNKKPKDGVTQITTTLQVETTTQTSNVNDIWRYDGAGSWIYQGTVVSSVSFGSITGSPSDNTNLAADLLLKFDKNKILSAWQTTADNEHTLGELFAKNELAKKVDKVNTTNKLYGTKTESSAVVQTTYGFSNTPNPSHIVQYDNAGRVRVDNTNLDASGNENCATPVSYVKENGQTAVEINIASETTSSGTLTEDDITNLKKNRHNYIVTKYNAGTTSTPKYIYEKYDLQDDKVESGYLAYSHIEKESTNTNIKIITVTISTRAWALTQMSIPNIAGNETLAGSEDYLNELTINATKYAIRNANEKFGNGYGTCATESADVVKVVTLSGYKLMNYGIVSVKFTNAVPANSSLNVNSTGDKAIHYKGSAITADIIKAGYIATFIYDGTNYILLSVDNSIVSVVDVSATDTRAKEINVGGVTHKVEHTEETVLWTNNTPSADFGNTTVNLNFKPESTTERYNVNDYDYIVIVYLHYKGGTKLISEEIKIQNGTFSYITSEAHWSYDNSSGYIEDIFRDGLLQNTQAIFEHAMGITYKISDKTISNIATRDDYLIPYKIIGYKYS